MSFTPHEIIVLAIVLLIIAVALAARYFGILLREDRFLADDDESEEAVEIDDDDDDDDADQADEWADEPKRAVEILDEYLPPASPEFVARFAAAYIEEKTELENSRMRYLAPRLFSDHWYEDTRRAFSQWAVEMREVYAIAS